ncbi:ABC transporter substrate-binding protein [Bacterioplanes sanyensis]|uniref:ABC transporter substrate-binding protein n=1 Tax=Bacterioplanes sanyensis TaxID=1249553 RepID=A0A222FJ98_9GAMM|nr:transporter substrate-binding domain-containing protein [Bacterioplanes sanyensis]ASP38850.1 ABC transporter substrate-binding protein [Bacterioplanes sanyensis]
MTTQTRIQRIFATLLTLLALTAHSEDKQVSIAVGSWPPFLSQEQQHDGYVAHLIRDVFESQGYQVSIQFMPWERAYREAAAGQHDATAVWMDKEERRLDFWYSDPVLSETFVFFHRSSEPFDWQNYSDLSDLTLGGGISYSYGEAMDQAIQDGTITLQRVSTTLQNFNRLAAGYIDAFPEEMSVGYFNLRQLPHVYDEIRHHSKPILQNNSFVLFPRGEAKSQQLRKDFNQGLQKFRDSGRYQNYYNNFNAGRYDLKPNSGQ